VPTAQPDAGAETGARDDTRALYALCMALSVVMGNLLPTQRVSEEVACWSSFVQVNIETDVQPLIAPAPFVSVNMILGVGVGMALELEFEEELGKPVLAATPADPVACRNARVLCGKGRGFVGTALVKLVRNSRATAKGEVTLLITTILK